METLTSSLFTFPYKWRFSHFFPSKMVRHEMGFNEPHAMHSALNVSAMCCGWLIITPLFCKGKFKDKGNDKYK